MTEEGPDGRQQDIRLTPPPRIEPVGAKLRTRRPSPAPVGRRGPAIVPPVRAGRPRWVAPLAFGLLALLGVLAVYLMRAGASPAPATPGGDVPANSASGGGVPKESTPGGDVPMDSTSRRAAPTNSPPGGGVGEGLAPSRTESRAGASPAPTRSRAEPGPAPATADAFGRALADGLAAIDAGELEIARRAFERAAAIDPASPEPAAGLARLEAASSRIAIEELREKARLLVEGEAWREAAAEYRAALAIDPTLTFARAGLELAESRAALAERLAYHLERPERLSAAAVLGEVDRLLETARAVEGAGPRHAAQVAALDQLADRVRRPVRVSLVSDGQTEVTVFQVGRLGTFARRELELRPGTYTVVGSRAGYRDVRRQLEVEPGEAPEPFEIRCEEKI